MKLKNATAAFALLGASALILSGCAAAPEAEPTETESAAETIDYLACAVSDEGSWNDKSFNESVYDGLLKAQSDLGVQIADAESNSAEDFAPNLQAMVDQGCDITFAVGFNLVADVNAAAAANPEVQFVTIDGWSEGNANLKPVVYNMAESSYLAGYLAAAYSTTKVIGTYGGMQIPAVTDFMDGFYYGAMAYAKDSGTSVKVVGWDPVAQTGDFMNDFAPNSAVSKTIATTQIQKGSDVIFPVGGDQFGAASEAITEAGIDESAPRYLNGVVEVETELTPEQLLEATREIETRAGRIRDVRWGPRTLDIDIITFGEVHQTTPELTLPHPRAHERAFVLTPWSLMQPEAVIPGRGKVAELAKSFPGEVWEA